MNFVRPEQLRSLKLSVKSIAPPTNSEQVKFKKLISYQAIYFFILLVFISKNGTQ